MRQQRPSGNDANTKVRFNHFLEKFPEIKPPMTLGENTQLEFSRTNDPLQRQMIEQYILPYEKQPMDEFTEYIACFRLPRQGHFQALVYWRGGLMDYRFILATYNKRGEMIGQRAIAGTFSDGDKVTQSVATIDEDGMVAIASGQNEATQEVYDAQSSTSFALEIMPDGTIENA